MVNMKELGMLESTIKRKRGLLRADWYLLRKEGPERRG